MQSYPSSPMLMIGVAGFVGFHVSVATQKLTFKMCDRAIAKPSNSTKTVATAPPIQRRSYS